MATSRKIVAFEAIRGLAALIVFNVHLAIAFYPQFHPRAGGIGASWPTSFFWNGRGAVIVFFVLSGYVLTRGYFDRRDPEIIVRLAIKRWPRLLFLTTVACMISWLFLVLMPDLYWYPPDNTSKLAAILADDGTPSFTSALLEGLIFTFFRGDNHFVSPLWTMAYEFGGSFIVFAMALLIGALRIDQRWQIALALVVLTAAELVSPHIFAFTLGMYVSLAASATNGQANRRVSLFILAAGLSILTLNKKSWLPGTLEIYALGSALLVFAFASSNNLQKAFDRPLFAWVGRISFPLYVVHYPIIGSIGWATFKASPEPIAPFVGVTMSIIVSFGLATLLAAADQRWRTMIDRGVIWLMAMLRLRASALHPMSRMDEDALNRHPRKIAAREN